MPVETVTQVFSRPSDRVVAAIERDISSLNLYRFAGFDVCQVSLDAMRETVDSIALDLTFETTMLVMLPGNRVLHWRWFSGLELIGGQSFPAISARSFDYLDSDCDLSESEDARDTRNTLNRRQASVVTVNSALDAIRRGMSTKEASQMSGISVSSIKRAKRRARSGNGAISADERTRSGLVLMAFDEDGNKVVPLPPAEIRQVKDLLRAGIHYRQVAEMFDLCARDVRLLGVRPEKEKS